MTKYPDELIPILDRIDPTFGKDIWCGQGWWDLIVKMNNELASVDPNYRIHQIKEKFGELRVYIAPSDIHQSTIMRKIVDRYERASVLTCEVTGKAGELMVKDGQYRTLNKQFIPNGWKPVH